MTDLLHRRLTTLLFFVLVLLSLAGQAQAQQNIVSYLEVPTGEWGALAVSPDGSRVYIANTIDVVAMIDTATDEVTLFNLPSAEEEWIDGLGIVPNSGELIVSTDIAIYKLNAETGAVLEEVAPPVNSWWAGPMAFTSDGSLAYLASVDEIFILQTAPLEIVDTNPVTLELDGLVARNPGWGADWPRAYGIAIGPNDDKLFVLGEEDAEDRSPVAMISGLKASTDYTNLPIAVELVAPSSGAARARIATTADRSMLVHSYGPAFSTADMTSISSGPLVPLSFEATMVAVAADGSSVYYGGWSSDNRLTHSAESILVANGTTFDLVDVGGNDLDGITGIDLPGAGGWDDGGSYNHHEMVITPDGKKIYVGAGGSGALVVDLVKADAKAGKITPDRGGKDGTVTVVVAGTWGDKTTLAIERGSTVIDGAEVTILPGGALQAQLDLTDAELGAYDVVITPPGQEATRIAEGFTVEEAVESATADVLGAATFIATGEATVEVIVQNTGNVDLIDLITTLRFAKGTRYKLSLPSAIPGGDTQAQQEFTEADDDGREMIWHGRLPPQRTYRFHLTIAGPTDKPPSQWDTNFTVTVGYITVTEEEAPAPADADSGGLSEGLGRRSYPVIGTLCTAMNALNTAIRREMNRQGNQVSNAQMREAMNRVMRDAMREFLVSTLKDLIVKGITIGAASLLFPPVGATLMAGTVASTLTDIKSCYDLFSQPFALGALFAFDPNDKLSTTGYDGFITGRENLRYRIRFENKADATAAANTVTITDVLDENLDLSTFELSGSSHPETLTTALDEETRTLTFTFTDIDLPPNATPPEGEGWVEFTIRPARDLPSRTVISNEASIVFDLNEPIVTPKITHTIDLDTPSSSVDALEETTTGTEIPVSWKGDDGSGVGVWDYTVYVAVDDGDFEPWLEATTETSATYTGEIGKRYRFYAVARDHLNNLQVADSEAAIGTRLIEGGDGDGDDDDGGCGCRVHAVDGPATLLGLALLLLLLRRRRQLAK